MGQRGFTLIEMLITLGLVVALGSIALPIVASRTDAIVLEESGRIVGTALSSARSQSIDLAIPIELSAVEIDGDVFLIATTVPGTSVQSDIEAFDPFDDADSEAEDAGPVRRGTRVFTRRLPSGVRLTAQAPATEDELELVPPIDDGAWPDDDAGGRTIVLALFLPDGGLAPTDPRYLLVGDRVARLTVDAWTGRVSLSVVESASSPSLAAGDEAFADIAGWDEVEGP